MAKKVPITVTLTEELLEWLEDKVADGTFGSISHAIRQCVATAKTYSEAEKKE